MLSGKKRFILYLFIKFVYLSTNIFIFIYLSFFLSLYFSITSKSFFLFLLFIVCFVHLCFFLTFSFAFFFSLFTKKEETVFSDCFFFFLFFFALCSMILIWKSQREFVGITWKKFCFCLVNFFAIFKQLRLNEKRLGTHRHRHRLSVKAKMP